MLSLLSHCPKNNMNLRVKNEKMSLSLLSHCPKNNMNLCAKKMKKMSLSLDGPFSMRISVI